MRTNRNLFVAVVATLALGAVALGGCKQTEGADAPKVGEPAGAEAATEKAAASAAVAPGAAEPATAEPATAKPVAAKPVAPKPVAIEPPEEHDEAGCGAETAGPGPAVEAVPAGKTPLGQAILHAGPDFTDAPEVSVSDLLANPDAWVGKKVTLTGDVSAMCHHRRSWFALTAADQSGKQVRVLTMPAFLVPRGSIGRTSRTEGVVETISVPASHARHLMKDHKLGDPSEVQGETMKQIVIRATSADFVEVAAR